jgi:hypothetical protein
MSNPQSHSFSRSLLRLGAVACIFFGVLSNQPAQAQFIPRYSAVWRPAPSEEIQVYGWKYEDFRAKYDELWPQGWRLHLLNNYVVNGEVLYTAVWRPSTEGEIQVYGWTYEDFRAKYDELWPQGWRLHIVAIYTTYDALTDYMRDCLTHNVPIPPDWPKGPTGNWVNLGVP